MIGEIEKPLKLAFESNRNPLSGGSFYFGVNKSVCKMWLEPIDKCWKLSTRANIKNYDNEIEAFLTWIKPWIDGGSGHKDMYAIVMHEESNEPTIYYLYDV